ncbi:MAG: hypothetical protein LBV67_04250 [Streptococcaceae bacterium]|jgi:ABC-type bacteriocin/lantibiotic exporter with double-glycine peptidase domain|nr:hypothetical protein [Streptococcaceae bacterium]
MIQEQDFKDIYLVLVGYLVISVITEIFSNRLNIFNLKYKEELDFFFSVLLLEKSNKTQLKKFENPSYYNAMQRAEIAGGQFPFQIMTSLIQLFFNFLLFVSYSSILLNWNQVSLVLIVGCPIIFWKIVNKHSDNEYTVAFERTNNVRKSWYYAHLLNKIENVKETRIWGLEKIFLKEFKYFRKKFMDENYSLNKRKYDIQLFFQIILTIISFLLIGYVIYNSLQGKILVGDLMLIITSIANTKSLTREIMQYLTTIHQNTLFSKDLIVFIESDENHDHVRDIKMEEIKIRKISFKDVSFSYIDGENVIDNFNFDFCENTNYLIVGKNGSGKSKIS